MPCSFRGPIGLASLALIIFPALCLAFDDEPSRQTLAGIKHFQVEVAVSDALIKAGVDTSVVRTSVELKLRQAGIGVVSRDDNKFFGPGLLVSLNGISSCSDVQYAVAVDVAVSRFVFYRKPSKKAAKGPVSPYTDEVTWAETWSTSSVVAVGRQVLDEYLRQVISDKVDRFLNAYLAANPTQSSLAR